MAERPAAKGMNMSNTKDSREFRIEWDLHEFGPRTVEPVHVAHGPKDPVKLLLALAVATGEVPANTADIRTDQAA